YCRLPFRLHPPANLPHTPPEPQPLRDQLTHFESCPITGIHLWFDRQITDFDHAVLLDRTIQWMFHKSRLLTTRSGTATTSSETVDGKKLKGKGREGKDPERQALKGRDFSRAATLPQENRASAPE